MVSFTFQISHPQKGVNQYPNYKAKCSVEKSLILYWHLILGNSGHAKSPFGLSFCRSFILLWVMCLFISDKSHTVASCTQEVCCTPSSDVTSVSHAMWYCQHIPAVDVQGAATQVLTGLWTLQFHPSICGVTGLRTLQFHPSICGVTGLWTLQFHPSICGVIAPFGPWPTSEDISILLCLLLIFCILYS